MTNVSFMDTLLDGFEVEWKVLGGASLAKRAGGSGVVDVTNWI